MGASEALRGYLIQATTCLFKVLANNDWETITMDPVVDNKVDMRIEYKDGTIEIIQVKSSINSIPSGDLRKLAQELRLTYPTAHISVFAFSDVDKSSCDTTLPKISISVIPTANYDHVRLIALGELERLLETKTGRQMTWLRRSYFLDFFNGQMLRHSATVTLFQKATFDKQWEDLLSSFKKDLVEMLQMEREESEAFEKIFGFTAKPIDREAIFRLYHSNDQVISLPLIKRAYKHLRLVEGKFRVHLNKDDYLHIWLCKGSIFFLILASVLSAIPIYRGNHDFQVWLIMIVTTICVAPFCLALSPYHSADVVQRYENNASRKDVTN